MGTSILNTVSTIPIKIFSSLLTKESGVGLTGVPVQNWSFMVEQKIPMFIGPGSVMLIELDFIWQLTMMPAILLYDGAALENQAG